MSTAFQVIWFLGRIQGFFQSISWIFYFLATYIPAALLFSYVETRWHIASFLVVYLMAKGLFLYFKPRDLQ